MTSQPRKRTAVLISGRGSNMTALIQAAMDPSFPAEIALVISNKADAKGLETARKAGIATRVISYRDHGSREAHDAAIDAALREAGIEIVALAGYMRLLTPGFVRSWQGRMINIHPALLPLFKGLDTHNRALDAGVRVHGCTVHFVTPDMDEGPIIAQAAVPVKTGDTEDTLAARVLEAEHATYPEALAMVARGDVRMAGNGRAIFRGQANAAG
ncbi:phosphoribosylglycinamide formyltransferase [Zhengella mangrovi]|uniref:Phosphoribosylglycinamide formyltransferase n=1 Tax=Zhengella mangrovi TaxID=1982044 RepID=A0A2G1QRT4_9HYPH|nr:phosphoribosylglycinamide formyltransferase [Zhengella mangrovi]PHP68215.1 phosphoribosylglycinamide formyltransferase [Zhengella mangrovi]